MIDNSFDEWWSHIEPIVIRDVVRILGSPEEAHDIAQDIATAAYINFDIFKDATHFYSWVKKRSRWLSLNQIRKHSRSTRLAETSERTEGGSQEYLVMRNELQAFIEKLPDNQKFVITKTLEGYDTREIARLLKIKPATVRSLRRHARYNLTKLLEEDDEPTK